MSNNVSKVLHLWKKVHQQPEFGQISLFLESSCPLVEFNLGMATATLQVPDKTTGELIQRYRKNIESAFTKALEFEVSIRLQVLGEDLLPPDKPEVSNQGLGAPYECYGLKFRSVSEMKIAHVLEKRKVLYFPNAKGRLLKWVDGGPYCLSGERRDNEEADFLICQEGCWGILECDGDEFHQSAALDHDRDRVWNANGIWFIQRFTATECYNNPERVVDQFLELLRAFNSQTQRLTVLSNEAANARQELKETRAIADTHAKAICVLAEQSSSDRLDLLERLQKVERRIDGLEKE